MESKTTLQPVTPDVILEAKAKYSEKRLRLVTVTTLEGDELEYLIRKPNRNVIEAVSQLNGDLTKTNKILIANCVLAGDADSLENDSDVYGEVMKQLGALMKGATSTVKKL